MSKKNVTKKKTPKKSKASTKNKPVENLLALPNLPDIIKEFPDFHKYPTDKKIYAIKWINPAIANTEIGKCLGLHESSVRRYFDSEEGRKFQESIDENFKKSFLGLQIKALKVFKAILDSHGNIAQKVTIGRFLLEKRLMVQGDDKPDEIHFETIISETGVMEQQTRKVYYKETYSKKVEDD